MIEKIALTAYILQAIKSFKPNVVLFFQSVCADNLRFKKVLWLHSIKHSSEMCKIERVCLFLLGLNLLVPLSNLLDKQAVVLHLFCTPERFLICIYTFFIQRHVNEIHY